MNTNTLKIGFIGAGGVNFGTSEGPWDHASRLEKYAALKSLNVEVSVIVDPDASRVERVLQTRRNGAAPHMYTNTRHCKTVEQMISSGDLPDAVFIGLPPDQHGTMAAPRNVEVVCGNAGISMFVEKPISCSPLSDVAKVAEEVNHAVKDKKIVVSVAYMLRYSSAVRKMQDLIREVGRPVVGVLGRYCSTYPSISKWMWWDSRQCGGPVVEQGTHFCDLSRFLGGDVDLDTVVSTAVDANEPLGDLSALPIDESAIEPQHRIPRMTSAMWRYKSGAIGTFSHTLLMHGTDYVAEIEVWGDGYRFVLEDPYHNPILRVRLPGSDKVTTHTFEGDDLYLNEVSSFIGDVAAAKYGKNNEGSTGVLSTYDDAVKSYELSVTIRDRAMRNSVKHA